MRSSIVCSSSEVRPQVRECTEAFTYASFAVFSNTLHFSEIVCAILLKMAAKRKYDSAYLKFGFTSIEVNKEVRPQCVICATVLSNEALKPTKLERHLKTVHPNLSDRPPEFFAGKLENLKKMKLGKSGTVYESSEKALLASFEVSQLIAKAMKPHTIGETLVKPCLITAVESVLGTEASKKIKEIPLSNNTVKARIDTMSSDIEDQLVCEIKKSPYFSLQCDETTDIAQCSQLLVFVRYLGDQNTIKEELLISEELEKTTKAKDVMKLLCDFFNKHGIEWEKLAGFCTDGAPAMLGSRSGLAALVKEKNSSTITMHCVIHRQALAAKTLPEDLSETLNLAIVMVNSVKRSALNTRVFKHLCAELDSDHKALLFHTEVRWLSKGNMLARLYELLEELRVFFIESKMDNLLQKSGDPYFVVQLAYLVDIFGYLNELNLKLQGSGNEKLEGVNNVFVFEDKLRAFLCKIDLWISKIEKKNYQPFQTMKHLADNPDYSSVTDKVQENMLCHLSTLKSEFSRYFPEYSSSETPVIKQMVRNPFTVKPDALLDDIQEDLIELQNDSDLRDTFESGVKVEEFWCKKAVAYKNIRHEALRYIMLFSTTYLCEQGFSAVLLIKNKQRNRLLSVSSDLRVALSKTISPRMSQLIKKAQAQKSH